jgi:anti-sigma-K factor RskA
MSRIADALVSRNLITRVLSVQDRRRMVLRITEEGEDLVRRLLPRCSASLRGCSAPFSESEQGQLISQLKRLVFELKLCRKRAEAGRRSGRYEGWRFLMATTCWCGCAGLPPKQEPVHLPSAAPWMV